MRINKHFFQNLDINTYSGCFVKTIPFCTFSDLKDPQYELIEKILNKIQYNKDLLISIGKKKAPFGVTVFPDDKKTLLDLYNSCQFSFVFTRDISETQYLLKSVLAGIIPICNEDHLYIKKLGLSRYSTDITLFDIVDTLSHIKNNPMFETLKINQLSWRYNRAMNKLG